MIDIFLGSRKNILISRKAYWSSFDSYGLCFFILDSLSHEPLFTHLGWSNKFATIMAFHSPPHINALVSRSAHHFYCLDLRNKPSAFV